MKFEEIMIIAEEKMKRGQFTEALEYWSMMRKEFPNKVEGYYKAAQAYIELNQYANAENICREAMAIFPHAKPFFAVFVASMRQEPFIDRLSLLFESNEYIDDNFFVISSENLDDVTPRLYGFAIHDDTFYINITDNMLFSSTDFGVYVNIAVDDEVIYIQQDYNGSYGLYLYRDDKYFAISNSLFYLAKYLMNKKVLTINEIYSKYFIKEGYTSYIPESIINEIELVPTNIYFIISRNQKNLVIQTNPSLPKIDLNTAHGINILDAWYHFYKNLCKSLCLSGKTVMADLSGGFDTRAILPIFLDGRTIHEGVNIFSNKGKGYTLEQDYAIALNFAKKYNFTLNNDLRLNTYQIASQSVLQSSFYPKLGVHLQMYFPSTYYRDRIYRFSGGGGECLRASYAIMNKDDFILLYTRNATNINNYKYHLHKFIELSINRIQQHYAIGSEVNFNVMSKFYREAGSRLHFGRGGVEQFLCGSMRIDPLLDYRLDCLNPFVSGNTDPNLLYAVIYSRYAPSILDIEFDNGKRLKESTIELARSINKRFPFIARDQHNKRINFLDETSIYPPENRYAYSAQQMLFNLFTRTDSKEKINIMFGQDAYATALKDCLQQIFFGYAKVCAELAYVVMKTICDLSSRLNNVSVAKLERYRSISSKQYIKNLLSPQISDHLVNCGEYVRESAPLSEVACPDIKCSGQKEFINECENSVTAKTNLPAGFSIESYLLKNPDVAKAEIDPVYHWFNFGQFENRQF